MSVLFCKTVAVPFFAYIPTEFFPVTLAVIVPFPVAVNVPPEAIIPAVPLPFEEVVPVTVIVPDFIVNNSKIKDNYDSHIGIYPLCSLDNVINGYLVGNDFYKLNLPTILIFYDKKCY